MATVATSPIEDATPRTLEFWRKWQTVYAATTQLQTAGGSNRGRRQVNPDPSESPVQQIVHVEQLPKNPRLLNVGPKPAKWAGNTPLSAFKTDLILHYQATELPKQKWGIASLSFLSDACRTTFLSKLAIERGLQADPELMAQEEITWSDLCLAEL